MPRKTYAALALTGAISLGLLAGSTIPTAMKMPFEPEAAEQSGDDLALSTTYDDPAQEDFGASEGAGIPYWLANEQQSGPGLSDGAEWMSASYDESVENWTDPTVPLPDDPVAAADASGNGVDATAEAAAQVAAEVRAAEDSQS